MDIHAKRTLKWLVAIVLAPVLLFVILTLLLYIPPVQNWAAKQVASYVSGQTGNEVTVGHVRLSFPLDLELNDFRMLHPNDSLKNVTDTIADVRTLVASIQLMPLFRGEVNVDELTFKQIKINTSNFIGDLRIKADLRKLHVHSHGVFLCSDSAMVDFAEFGQGRVEVALGDTIPEDTTKKKTLWQIQVGKVILSKTDFRLHMPGDTMSIHANFHETVANNVRLNLHDNIYKVGSLDWHGGDFNYDLNYERFAPRGFDSNHIAFNQINIGVDSFMYSKPLISCFVRAANLREKSGVVIDGFHSHFGMGNHQLWLPDLYLKMPSTELSGNYRMDMNAFDEHHPGRFIADADGYVTKKDLMPFLTTVSNDALAKIPDGRINVKGHLQGNLKRLDFKGLQLKAPSAIDVSGTGYLGNLDDSDNLLMDARLKVRTHDSRYATSLLPADIRKDVRIPTGLNVDGRFKIDRTTYSGNFNADESGGKLRAKFFYDTRDERYDLTANATGFPVGHFMPHQQMKPFTGTVSLNGRGTDFLSGKSAVNLNLDSGSFSYGKWNLDGIKGRVTLQGDRFDAVVNSVNSMIGGNFRVNGTLRENNMDVRLKGLIRNADLKALGVMDKRWIASTDADVRIKSDLDETYYVKGWLGQLNMREVTRKGSTPLVSGDFNVDGSYKGSMLDTYIRGELRNANLRGLGVVDQPYHVSSVTDVRVRSDFDHLYAVDGRLGRFCLHERRDSVTIPLVTGDFDVDVTMNGQNVGGKFNGDVTRADLYHLGVTADPYVTTFGADVTFSSNMDDRHALKGTLSNLIVNEKNRSYSAGDLDVDVLSRADVAHAVIRGGDFDLNAAMSGSWRTLMTSINTMTDELNRQIANKQIDQTALRKSLPDGRFVLTSGHDNILTSVLASMGYKFGDAAVDLTSSPLTGLNGTVRVGSLVLQDSIVIDTLRVNLNSEDDRLRYNVLAANTTKNSYPYRAMLEGTFFERGIRTEATLLDGKGKKALGMGLQAEMKGEGIELSVTSPRSVIGYKEFAVNDSNYFYIGRNRRVFADMKLLADDGAGVQIDSNDDDSLSLQNVTLSMNNFELDKLFTVLPFAPNMTGVLNGDYHVIQTADELTVSSDMTVRNMVYEGMPMGNIGANLVYMPQGDGTHFVDAIITQNGRNVGQLTGNYDEKGRLDADFELDKFPLGFVNGFVPDRIVGLRGVGEGTLRVEGPLDALDINGEVYLDSSYLYSDPYGLEMRFADDPVTIRHSRLLLENFEMFANNAQPLNLSGYFDFSDFDNMYLDARMRAQNFELIDSRENPRSTVYGKAFVNFTGRINGPLDRLRMGGKLDVLGNTDMTYVMRDTPLSTDNQMEELVHFTNFNDSTPDVIIRPRLEGFQMDLSVDIDEQAHIVCALNAEHTNYIDLIGGGSLLLHYDPANDMTLRGRYTLSSGQLKYSIEMIPLRTFDIQEGSYIQFTGEPTNPTLNITATDEVRANYSASGTNDRLVNFIAGVHLTKDLSQPGVEFIVNAPEDTEAQNDLNTRSTEEKGKIAVTLLASGMFLSEGSGNNFAMNGALASFMQNQINQVTGRALSSMGLDVTANMESTADATGALHTDYTFNFSKRLWNNRLRIIMGGRVSTGSDVGADNGAYFDNFSLEYRLNQQETQYLKLYYDRQAYDWLEGELSEFGAGFMWRRKLQHFKDIFRFKSKTAEPVAPPVLGDTLIRFSNEKKK